MAGHITAIVESKNDLDINKVYEAIARIIGQRTGVEIKVVNLRKRKPEDGKAMFAKEVSG